MSNLFPVTIWLPKQAGQVEDERGNDTIKGRARSKSDLIKEEGRWFLQGNLFYKVTASFVKLMGESEAGPNIEIFFFSDYKHKMDFCLLCEGFIMNA